MASTNLKDILVWYWSVSFLGKPNQFIGLCLKKWWPKLYIIYFLRGLFPRGDDECTAFARYYIIDCSITDFNSPLPPVAWLKKFCFVWYNAKYSEITKEKSVRSPAALSCTPLRSVSFGSDNTVYEARSCRRSTHIFSPCRRKNISYTDTLAEIFLFFFGLSPNCFKKF